jgi:hypothetical protein
MQLPLKLNMSQQYAMARYFVDAVQLPPRLAGISFMFSFALY